MVGLRSPDAPLRTIALDTGLGVLTAGVVYLATRSGNLVFGTVVVGVGLVFLTGFTTGMATNQSVGALGATTRTHGGDDRSEREQFGSFVTVLPIGSVRGFLLLYGAGMAAASLAVLVLLGHTLA